jgi:hypothetical protein
MCTDFCICPGLPTDAHYKEYEQVPAETYAKYNRTFDDFTGEINLAAFADPKKKKPLFWTFDPATKKQDANLYTLSSKSMIDCFENIPTIVEKYEEEKKKKAV